MDCFSRPDARSPSGFLGSRMGKDLHPVFHALPQKVTSREFFVTIGLSLTLKGVVMTTEGHIAALERRHQELERQIESELAHISRDDLLISALKRRKLEVKDELNRSQKN
jgi:hypothetical protein